MELIDIIFDVLVFGGALLALTVIFSFYISKRKPAPDALSVRSGRYDSVKNNWQSQRRSDNEYYRKNQDPAYPQIFQIDQSKQVDIRIIPKTAAPSQNSRGESKPPTVDRSGTSRYKIMNEELKQAEDKAVNFYS